MNTFKSKLLLKMTTLLLTTSMASASFNLPLSDVFVSFAQVEFERSTTIKYLNGEEREACEILKSLEFNPQQSLSEEQNNQGIDLGMLENYLTNVNPLADRDDILRRVTEIFLLSQDNDENAPQDGGGTTTNSNNGGNNSSQNNQSNNQNNNENSFNNSFQNDNNDGGLSGGSGDDKDPNKNNKKINNFSEEGNENNKKRKRDDNEKDEEGENNNKKAKTSKEDPNVLELDFFQEDKKALGQKMVSFRGNEIIINDISNEMKNMLFKVIARILGLQTGYVEKIELKRSGLNTGVNWVSDWCALSEFVNLKSLIFNGFYPLGGYFGNLQERNPEDIKKSLESLRDNLKKLSKLEELNLGNAALWGNNMLLLLPALENLKLKKLVLSENNITAKTLIKILSKIKSENLEFLDISNLVYDDSDEADDLRALFKVLGNFVNLKVLSVSGLSFKKHKDLLVPFLDALPVSLQELYMGAGKENAISLLRNYINIKFSRQIERFLNKKNSQDNSN